MQRHSFVIHGILRLLLDTAFPICDSSFISCSLRLASYRRPYTNSEDFRSVPSCIRIHHDIALQTCTRTGKRGVTSVLVTDVLASTGNILEVVVTLVASIITESTMTNTILGTLERCEQRRDQANLF